MVDIFISEYLNSRRDLWFAMAAGAICALNSAVMLAVLFTKSTGACAPAYYFSVFRTF